jgi:hypothetical protein
VYGKIANTAAGQSLQVMSDSSVEKGTVVVDIMNRIESLKYKCIIPTSLSA